MQVTWEQFEDPLWILIRLITSWMSTSCCFDGKCLSCKMPPLPSSLKKFSSVWSGAPRSTGNNENAAIATQLISKLCNLPVVVLFLPNYYLFYYYFSIPCFSVDLLPWFVHIWELLLLQFAQRWSHPALTPFEMVGLSLTDARMWESSHIFSFEIWDMSHLSF